MSWTWRKKYRNRQRGFSAIYKINTNNKKVLRVSTQGKVEVGISGDRIIRCIIAIGQGRFLGNVGPIRYQIYHDNSTSSNVDPRVVVFHWWFTLIGKSVLPSLPLTAIIIAIRIAGTLKGHPRTMQVIPHIQCDGELHTSSLVSHILSHTCTSPAARLYYLPDYH